MNEKVKISGLIITYNEENNIVSLLENIDFVDEIIIVDSFSKDQTKKLAIQNPKVVFFENVFIDFTSQRNFALSKASNDWILFLDGDERLTHDLKIEIVQTLEQKFTKDAYYFYRKFLFQNKLIRFSGTQTDKNFRLFKKSKCSYTAERLVHETLHVHGSIGIFKNKLLHYSYFDYKDYKNKMITYGRLKAKELHQKGKKSNIMLLVFKPMYKFLYSFLIRLGFLDGYKGLIICYLHALSVFETYKELNKLQN